MMTHVIMVIVVIEIVVLYIVYHVDLVQLIRHQNLQLHNPPLCRLLGATQTQPQLRFLLRVRRLQRQLLLVETQEQPVMLTAVPGQQAPIGRLESGHQMIQNVVLNVVELIGVNTMVVVEDGVAQEIV